MTHTEAVPTEAGTAEPEFGLAVGLVRLAGVVQHVFGEISREYDLTSQQTQLLCMLVNGPVPMATLSRLLHLEKSSLTGLVDRVERRGLVRRQRCAQDRRVWRVSLTDEGERLGNDTHRDTIDRLEKLAGDIPANDRDQLTALIARMVRGTG
ncbi:DNA-binding MarR family transcriptional regulator [Tamaricihabitans halophyticus]|uniref:DNA-binding MarR family transcriptional regulator n=1 Tax=Tamaricihabitans halophyticus TaxID=1262583 RepID=A0A4R2QGA9_9PSEU|nr:MarR family transcriptional regulator [Tamaricihabitans halophyticus]TCP47368.1 DNA-binding MarR family transcriptional regulator [Tamaricihabitans halophyticus]